MKLFYPKEEDDLRVKKFRRRKNSTELSKKEQQRDAGPKRKTSTELSSCTAHTEPGVRGCAVAMRIAPAACAYSYGRPGLHT